MTRSHYDKLIATLDVFIDEYGGQIRFRGIQTALLIHKASLEGRGISASEVRKVTDAPLENIRRHFTRQVEKRILITEPDDDDERVVRYRTANPDVHQQIARRMAARLQQIGPPHGEASQTAHPLGSRTYDSLLAVLQAYSDSMDGSLRIRGIKMAVIILQASASGRGLTASQISRLNRAPLETVRRFIQAYVEMGVLELVEDPQDHRASLVRYTEPERIAQMFDRIAGRLDDVDWSTFNLTD